MPYKPHLFLVAMVFLSCQCLNYLEYHPEKVDIKLERRKLSAGSLRSRTITSLSFERVPKELQSHREEQRRGPAKRQK